MLPKFGLGFALVLLIGACALPGRDCAPVYGNWCGKGYPSEGANPRAIDKWDRACRVHDKCYESKGDGNKSCDRAFLTRMNGLAQTDVPPKEIVAAYGVFGTKTGQQIGGNFFFDLENLLNWVAADCEGAAIGENRPARTCVTDFGRCAISWGQSYRGDPCFCQIGWRRDWGVAR